MATAKKAPAKKAPAKKVTAPAKASAPKKSAAPPKKAAPAAAKQAATPAKKSAPAKKAAPPPAKKAAAAPVAKQAAAAPEAPTKKAAPAPAKKAAPAKKSATGPVLIEIPAVKGVTKDGVAYTKDFDVKFLTAQRALLLEEKAALLGQATRLEDEANSLIEEQEMGDVQFDDEGGEGDTMVVERERDLTLSAQARQTIADIETALDRLSTGRYGYSTESGRPIPRERLEAIPWATMLVEEKVGGIGRR
jgi:RNA polymerase-binding transcription factor DksA